MIKEAYCSFEIAKLLKEKGFDVPTWTCYIGNEISHYDYTSSNSELVDGIISAPTHQMAMAWLREKKIFIRIIESFSGESFRFEVYCKEAKLSIEIDYYIDNHYENSYEEAVEKALKYVLTNLI